jgi:hypothetical protein
VVLVVQPERARLALPHLKAATAAQKLQTLVVVAAVRLAPEALVVTERLVLLLLTEVVVALALEHRLLVYLHLALAELEQLRQLAAATVAREH